MFIACGSAWRADPRVNRGWCRPKSTHQHALEGTPIWARAAEGPDFVASRNGRGRLAAAAHGLRARAGAMMQTPRHRRCGPLALCL